MVAEKTVPLQVLLGSDGRGLIKAKREDTLRFARNGKTWPGVQM